MNYTKKILFAIGLIALGTSQTAQSFQVHNKTEFIIFVDTSNQSRKEIHDERVAFLKTGRHWTDEGYPVHSFMTDQLTPDSSQDFKHGKIMELRYMSKPGSKPLKHGAVVIEGTDNEVKDFKVKPNANYEINQNPEGTLVWLSESK